jgi:hypothetical protein
MDLPPEFAQRLLSKRNQGGTITERESDCKHFGRNFPAGRPNTTVRHQQRYAASKIACERWSLPAR